MKVFFLRFLYGYYVTNDLRATKNKKLRKFFNKDSKYCKEKKEDIEQVRGSFCNDSALFVLSWGQKQGIQNAVLIE